MGPARLGILVRRLARPVFVHFFHDQLLTLAQVDAENRHTALEAALKWAILLSRDPLYIPTVDLVQSPVLPRFTPELTHLAKEGLLWFVGSSASIEAIHSSKQAHFRRTSLDSLWRDRASFERLSAFESVLTARNLNSTLDLKLRWMDDMGALASGRGNDAKPSLTQFRQALAAMNGSRGVSRALDKLSLIPQRLEEHAFLWRVIEDLRILGMRTTPEARRHFELGLAWHWIVSHVEEFDTTILGRISRLGDMSFGLRISHPDRVYDLYAYAEALKTLRLDKAFDVLSIEQTVALRGEPGTIALLEKVVRPLAALQYGASSNDPSLLVTCQSVRDEVGRASTPEGAFHLASKAAMGRDKHGEADDSAAGTVTVVVPVALAEELRIIHGAVLEVVGDLTHEEDAGTGGVVYRATHIAGSGRKFDLIFGLVGKGQERAAAATSMLVMQHDPDLIVNVGIAGSMSNDASLGDVVVGTEVSSYLADSKAVASGGAFEFRLGGDTVRCDELLTDRANQLDMLRPDGMRAYRERLASVADRQPGREALGDMTFQVHVAPIACGPTVGAANAFKDWLRSHKRNYAAIDMESSGVGIATDLGAMVRRRRFVALRGISDLADEGKAELEGDSKGAARHIATVAPLMLLIELLEALPSAAFRDRIDR